MTTSSAWSLSFVAAALVANGVWADFKFSLEPPVIQPGQRAALTLRLPESDLLEEAVPEAQDEWLVKTDGLELLDQDYRKENGEYIWKYQFTAYELGTVSIPPIAVTLGPQSFSTERVTLTVVSDRAEGDAALRPNAGPVSPPWDRLFWFGLLAIATAAAVAYFFRRRLSFPRRRKPAVAQPEAPKENPVDWLRKQLLILRTRIDSLPDDGHSPDAWSAILREFVTRKLGRPVTAWTTMEIRQRLQTDPQLTQLTELFQDCDRYKFSPDRGGRKGIPAAQLTLQWISESEKLFL